MTNKVSKQGMLKYWLGVAILVCLLIFLFGPWVNCPAGHPVQEDGYSWHDIVELRGCIACAGGWEHPKVSVLTWIWYRIGGFRNPMTPEPG